VSNSLAYRITIGSQSLSNKATDNERLLLSATIRLAMDGHGNSCELLLGDAENIAPKLLDNVTVELDAGTGMKKIFTGTVDTVRINATEQRITAFDNLNQLGRLHTEASYENVNADFVVKDLLKQADISAGTINKGVKLSALVISKNTTALSQLLQLASWCGSDLYSDGEGKAHFTLVKETGKECSFQYGINVQRLELQATPPAYDSVEIMGEGAASSQGAEKFYWLVKDLAGVSGKAAIDAKGVVKTGQLGKKPRRLILGAVRSGETANQVAENTMQALAGRWLRGKMVVTGAPQIQLADSVKISDLPDKHSATSLLQGGHTLRVRGICHTLDRKRGFMTEVEF
jgi:hypothetical protein